MDMSERFEPEQPGRDHLEALVEPILRLMCITSSAFAESNDDHRADLATMLDIIAVEVLKHNFEPGDWDGVFNALNVHCDNVRDIFEEAREYSRRS